VRRRWLADVGPPGFVVADDTDVAARRDAQLDVMADLLTSHLDVDAVMALLDDEPPIRPTITSKLTT
jgi:adenosylcobyric acid synthase